MIIVGWLVGLAVAVVIVLGVTALTPLSNDAAFLMGFIMGPVCTSVGMFWGAKV